MRQPAGTGAARASEHTPASPCRVLDWDTEFWGRRIARVEGRTVTSEELAGIDAWCIENEIACLFLLIDAGDRTSTLAAERSGFFFTDVRIAFTADLTGRRVASNRPAIRAAAPGDRERLLHLARISHRITRFFHDPYFDDERCAELYARWLASGLDGAAEAVLVADVAGAPAGYVTCELQGEGETGRIGLIAVDPSCQGRGLGLALCEASFDWFAEAGAAAVEIVTQGRNVPAQRVFQRAGARTIATQLWFHKWYSSPL
jgi:ribosomal protein S18 acetylase RimI-like enzyme